MKYLILLYRIVSFIGFYLFNLVKSNLVITYDILTPVLKTNPIFIQVPIRIQSNAGILLFSNLVSMTPGSLSYDISEDKKFMTVHILYKKSHEEMIKEVDKIQERIIKMSL